MTETSESLYTYTSHEIQKIAKQMPKNEAIASDIQIQINHLVNIMNIYSNCSNKSHMYKTARECTLQLICGYLNKITEKTYSSISKILKVLMRDHNNEKDLLLCGKHIFHIVSKDMFYAKLYSRLFYDLMQEFELLKNIFHEQLRVYSKSFESIQQYKSSSISIDDEYEFQREKDKRRTMATFFIYVLDYNIPDIEVTLHYIIETLWKHIDTYVNCKDHKDVVDEIFYLLYILIIGMYSHKKDVSMYKDKIQFYMKSNVKDYESFSHKARFKCMDIYDAMKRE